MSSWEARPTGQAYKDKRLLQYIDRAFDPVVRHIGHCLQSAQWSEEEPWSQDLAEAYFADLLEQKADHEAGLTRLQEKFAALEARVRKRKPLPLDGRRPSS